MAQIITVANVRSFGLEWATEKYTELVRDNKIEDIRWRIEHLLRVLDDERNDGSISDNAHEAHLKVKDAFVHRGVEGALVHVQWLLSALERCKNQSVLNAAETLAIGLGLAT